MKKVLSAAILMAMVVGISYFVRDDSPANADHKDIEYKISGETITLEGDYEYFGNEVRKDINGDGREDIAFLITEKLGEDTRFFLVGALGTESGYVGTDAVLIGSNISPQTTESGPESTVVVNYAVDQGGVSAGKSLRLLLDPENNQFGEVVIDFEGESAY